MDNYRGLAIPPIVAAPVLTMATFALGFTIGPRGLLPADGIQPGGQEAMTITESAPAAPFEF